MLLTMYAGHIVPHVLTRYACGVWSVFVCAADFTALIGGKEAPVGGTLIDTAATFNGSCATRNLTVSPDRPCSGTSRPCSEHCAA
jgi:hypothetical protein